MEKKEKSNKINFFKKIYISLFKTPKYSEIQKEGIKQALKYIMGVLLILGAIYSGILTYKMSGNANKLKSYLNENLPKLKYENKTLNVEADKRIVLDDNSVKVNFGGQIVIDTITNYDELVEEYKNKKEATILLTAEKFTTINSEGIVQENTYDDIIKKYLGQEPNTLDKDTLLYLFDNISYSYYFVVYTIAYIMAHLIIVVALSLIISLIIYLVNKVKKINIKFGTIYTMSIYALTITMIAFFAANFVPVKIKMYIQAASVIASAVYLWFATENSNKL